MANRIKQLYDHVKTENTGTSQRQCERFAKELYSRYIENKLNVQGSYRSFEQLAEDWEQVRKTYMSKTQGPAQMEVLSTWLYQRMTESMQKVWNDLRTGLDGDQSELKKKLAESELRSNAARDNLDQERSKQNESLEVAKRQWLSERMELERQLEDARQKEQQVTNQAGRERAQLVDSERALRDQIKLLQERLQASAAEARRNAQMDAATTATSSELQSLKDSVISMMSEMKGLDTEKKTAGDEVRA